MYICINIYSKIITDICNLKNVAIVKCIVHAHCTFNGDNYLNYNQKKNL